MPTLNPSLRGMIAALALLAFGAAHASCGSTSCTLLTDRFALDNWDHVGWTVDSRFESITQDRLRRGTSTISAEQAAAEEESVERRTRNLLLVTTLERAIDSHWSVGVQIPLVSRDHAHLGSHDHQEDDEAVRKAHPLHDEGEAAEEQRWRFTRPGDIRLTGRYQQADPATGFGWALIAGLKLPTGAHRIANGEGELAERSLQPGTGTTDLILGASVRHLLDAGDALSAGITLMQPLNSRASYKPGHRLELSMQWAHAFNPVVSGVLQLSASHRGRDSGAEGEPALSGSSTLAISPGVSVAVGAQTSVNGFLQLPVWQRVNGIQLVARYGLSVGMNHAF